MTFDDLEFIELYLEDGEEPLEEIDEEFLI